MSPGLASRPFSPSITKEEDPIALATRQGTPHAIASKVTLPKVSVYEGNKNKSELAYARAKSSLNKNL